MILFSFQLGSGLCLAALVFAPSLQAQPRVAFGNRSGGVNAPVSVFTGSGFVLLDGSQFPTVAQLYYGPEGTAEFELLPAPETPVAFRSGAFGQFTGPARTLTGIAPGTRVICQVRIWSAGWPSFETALTNRFLMFGKSSLFTLQTSATTGATVAMTGLQPFNLLPGGQPCGVGLVPVVSVSTGATVHLTVPIHGLGTVFSYWSKDGVVLGMTNGVFLGSPFPEFACSGTGVAELTLNNVTLAQSGSYRLTACGPLACLTGDVTLTVEEAARLAGSISNGAVNLTIAGRVGVRWIVEGSTDLRSWTPLYTNTVPPEGAFEFANNPPDGQVRRFYRAVAR